MGGRRSIAEFFRGFDDLLGGVTIAGDRRFVIRIQSFEFLFAKMVNLVLAQKGLPDGGQLTLGGLVQRLNGSDCLFDRHGAEKLRRVGDPFAQFVQVAFGASARQFGYLLTQGFFTAERVIGSRFLF